MTTISCHSPQYTPYTTYSGSSTQHGICVILFSKIFSLPTTGPADTSQPRISKTVPPDLLFTARAVHLLRYDRTSTPACSFASKTGSLVPTSCSSRRTHRALGRPAAPSIIQGCSQSPSRAHSRENPLPPIDRNRNIRAYQSVGRPTTHALAMRYRPRGIFFVTASHLQNSGVPGESLRRRRLFCTVHKDTDNM